MLNKLNDTIYYMIWGVFYTGAIGCSILTICTVLTSFFDLPHLVAFGKFFNGALDLTITSMVILMWVHVRPRIKR